MTLLPEIENRLVEVAEERFRQTRQRDRTRLWLPRSSRALLVTCALLVMAVPAVAATGAWEPILGKPSVNGGSPRAAADAIPDEQRQMLSILRRNQTDQDHSAETLGLLQPLSPTTDGVRLQGVRLLNASTDNPSVALVPVMRLFKRFPNQGGELLARDALCLTDKSNVVCATANQVKAGGLTGFEGTYTYGIVPDGVVSVRIHFADGHSKNLEVHDNFYGAKLSPLPTIPQSDASHLTLMLQRDPVTDMTPRAPATMTWLDAQGHEVLRLPSGA